MSAQTKQKPFSAENLRGFKYLKGVRKVFERLHDHATARDTAGNRQLFYDHYASLLLLTYFNPIISTLRGTQHASTLAKVQQTFGGKRTSLGSLSEASRVFDPELLHGIFRELVQRNSGQTQLSKKESEALADLTAVDGTLLKALPRLAWALWQDPQHRAVKMHLHFDVVQGVSREVSFTPAIGSEVTQLRKTIESGRLYVLDRGYACFQLLQDILDAQSAFIVRLQDHTAFDVVSTQRLKKADRAAGVTRDVVVDLGSAPYKHIVCQPVRLIFVAMPNADHADKPITMILATNRLDLSAELVVAAYRYRWQIELFFRWFKHILGCRHLLSHSPNGVAIQLYVALIASLLVTLWTGKKPNKRTWEMLQWYFAGWASEEEMAAHIASLPERPTA